MNDWLRKTVNWYKWLLKFHPLKYLGIFMMVVGPLFFIYRFIFLNSQLFELFFGSSGFLLMGVFIWSHGWDPYHDHY